MPGRLRGLTDVDEFGSGGQQTLEFGVLIAVGGVEVDVQPGMPVLRFVAADEEDRRLRAARKHPEVTALAHELTDTACHGRHLLSARELPGVRTRIS